MEPSDIKLDRVIGTIHPDTGIGLVHLSVINLDRQIKFYKTAIGFKLHWRSGASAGLGAGKRDLLLLTEEPDARRYQGTTGMYHFAILLPSQRELARVISRLMTMRYPNAPTDHVMTKTTYLDDPEGNNIEIYAESPEDGIMGVVNGSILVQRVDGTFSNGREPLDLERLFAQMEENESLEEEVPAETKLGHVHLYTTSLEKSLTFYHQIVGLDNMGVSAEFRMGMVSAGGYHHHIGFNTWKGEGAPPVPEDALGMRYFTLILPNVDELSKTKDRIQLAGVEINESAEGILLQDPSQIKLMLTI